MASTIMVNLATPSVPPLVIISMAKSAVKMKEKTAEKYNVNTLTLSLISTNVPAGSAPIKPNVSIALIRMANHVMCFAPQMA